MMYENTMIKMVFCTHSITGYWNQMQFSSVYSAVDVGRLPLPFPALIFSAATNPVSWKNVFKRWQFHISRL